MRYEIRKARAAKLFNAPDKLENNLHFEATISNLKSQISNPER